MAMIDCPHPLVCGAQKHHADKGAIDECRRRGERAASVQAQSPAILASAASSDQLSPQESSYVGVFATAQLAESNGISTDGRHVGVDTYSVELEFEATDATMTATFSVPHGDLPPQAREVVSNLIVDRESMIPYSSNWRGWAQNNGLSTEEGGPGQREWERTLSEHEQLANMLGSQYPAIASAVRKEKLKGSVTLAPSGVSPQALASMDRVLGSRPAEAIIQARPADLFVDMVMSGEEPVDLNDVVAWQAAVVGSHLARSRQQTAPVANDSFEVTSSPMRPAQLRAEMAAAFAEGRSPSDAAALLSLQSLAMVDPAPQSPFVQAASGHIERAALLSHLDQSRHDRQGPWNDEQRQAMDVLSRWAQEHK